jgi:CheY-like chemotaxis protein
VALIDTQMPGLDGEALGRAVRADTRLGATRLVLLGVLGKRGDARRLREMGFAGYSTKPIRSSELQKVVHRALAEQAHLPIATRHLAREVLPSFAGSRVRVLLAEDNITNQQVALGMLRKLGVTADAVADGQEAVRAAEQIAYDLVLMDCQMPNMDGYEATRRIRSATSSRDPALPIIAMTGHAMPGDRERSLAAGMFDHLTKPVTLRSLATCLEKWLRSAPHAPGTKPSSGAAPAWDRAALVERLMGDEELAATIAEGFLGDLPRQLDALSAALSAGDAGEVTRLAHGIKGASVNVGADSLGELAHAIEVAARLADLATAAQRFELVGPTFDRVRGEMDRGVAPGSQRTDRRE